MIKRVLGWGLLAAFLLGPSLVFAAGTTAFGAFVPGNTVGVGTRVSFSMITSGISSPFYTVTDSFGGGVNNSNIDAQGNFSWVPNQDDVGAHLITVTASDVYGAGASASMTITVVKPSVTISNLSPGATVRFGTPVSFQITASGFTGPSYSVVDSFPNSSLGYLSVTESGLFHWVPLLRDIGTHVLTVSAKDMQGHYGVVSQTIVVEGLPSVSVLGAPAGIGAGQMLSFTATTTGFSSPSFTVTDLFYTGSATSTLKLEGNKVSWTPVYNDLGVHTFLVSATDSAGHSASTKVSVTVGPASAVYAPPVAAPAPAPAAPSTPSQPSKPAAAYAFKSFLTVGSRGAEVTALQQKLIALGLLSSEPTGYFGALTKKAVQAFQKSKGLEQVGFTGPGTRAALNK